ncbi:hypothetical protein AB685_21475 [Bacillus sp. LL01]|uniref:hypothetical protein n=1 Tax=Bacillus sp. LL01 TaxID=1665556 RepID=UPI00064CE8D4|nr:hypothetical protein [Bacillus sp. LL01]KMJ56500.1 hypothetical protein AB685_21475 [Bacillus sp. LL01]
MELVSAVIKRTAILLLKDGNGVGTLFVGGVRRGQCSFECTKQKIESYKDRTYLDWQYKKIHQAYNWNLIEQHYRVNVKT